MYSCRPWLSRNVSPHNWRYYCICKFVVWLNCHFRTALWWVLLPVQSLAHQQPLMELTDQSLAYHGTPCTSWSSWSWVRRGAYVGLYSLAETEKKTLLHILLVLDHKSFYPSRYTAASIWSLKPLSANQLLFFSRDGWFVQSFPGLVDLHPSNGKCAFSGLYKQYNIRGRKVQNQLLGIFETDNICSV